MILLDFLNKILFFNFYDFPVFGIIIAFSTLILFFIAFRGRKFFNAPESKNKINIENFLSCVGGSAGVGSIIGGVVSVQVAGAGVIFWILFSSIFLAIVKFYEIYISCLFIDTENKNIQNLNGVQNSHALIGPFFYIKNVFTIAPKLKAISNILFWIFTFSFTLGYLAVGIIQVNQIIVLSKGTIFSKILLGGLISAVIIIFAFYKQDLLHKFSEVFVPLMIIGLFYLCFCVIFKNTQNIKQALYFILSEAFKPSVATLGFFYSVALQRLTLGADIGTGVSGLLNASATHDTDYKKQALLSALESVIVGCFMSLIGFTIIVTGFDASQSFGLDIFHDIVAKDSTFRHFIFLFLIFSFGTTTAVTRLYSFIYGFLVITKNRFKSLGVFIFGLLCILSFSYELKDVLIFIDVTLLFASIINIFCMIIYATRVNKSIYV